MTKDGIKVKYQSHAPEVSRNLNEINEYLFPSGQHNCVKNSQIKPKQKSGFSSRESWDSLTLWDIVFPVLWNIDSVQ